jgi:hypothetical protein
VAPDHTGPSRRDEGCQSEVSVSLLGMSSARNNKNSTAEVSLYVSAGAPGIDDRPDNPLTRGMRKLFDEGGRLPAQSPVKHLLPVHYEDPHNGKLRWFGVFVQSHSGLLMWFPGLALPVSGVEFQLGRGKSSRQSFHLDHVTLAPATRDLHITTQGSRARRGLGRSMPLGSDRLFWLALTVGETTQLREVAQRTVARFGGLPDGHHGTARAQAVKAAVEGSPSLVLRMNGPRPWLHSLVHFAVIAVPLGAAPYQGSYLAMPNESPHFVPTEPPGMKKIPVQVRQARLSPEWVLQFVTAWCPGRLRSPIAASMTAPGRLVEPR